MKQIVIFESTLTPALAKLAISLKKTGFNIVIINLIDNHESSFSKRVYDIKITFNSKFIKFNSRNILKMGTYSLFKSITIIKNFIKIKKLKPYVVIARAPPNWFCLIIKTMFNNYPFIYFPYDIRSFRYETIKDIKKDDISRFEIESERLCFEKSDGIIHKGDEKELNFLGEEVFKKKIKIKCPVLHFLPYCLGDISVPINRNKLSNKNGSIHIAYTGHIDISDLYMEPIREIINQGIHLHIYNKTINMSEKREEEKIEDFKNRYSDIFKNKFLHIHSPLSPENLNKDISKYDYSFFGCGNVPPTKDYILATGHKFFTSLEAGLPMIYLKNFRYMDKLSKRYKINIGINFSELKNLKRILKQKNYRILIKDVEEARKILEINKHIPRMLNFFEEVRRFKYDH